MQNHFSFLLDSIEVDIANEEVKNLSQLLSCIGGKASISKRTDSGIVFLNIDFSEDTLQKKLTRSAGRKRIYNFDCEYTYGDIRAWKAQKVPEGKILSRLNCTRSTFYRRMREAREADYPDSQRWV